jgi:DNA-binding beta-propeller fold protein YncE
MKAKLFAPAVAFVASFAFLGDSTSLAQNLFVTSDRYSTVEEFDSSGTYVGSFENGGLSQPTGLAFDSSGNLYVASLYGCPTCGLGTGYIEEFDPLGNFVSIIRSAGGLYRPEDLAFDSKGNLYAANAGNIEEFTSSGGVLSTNGTSFASAGLNQPVGLAFDGAGNLFVASSGNNTIEKFDPSGAGTPFAGTGLNAPQGLAFDSSGNLFVANSGDNTIEEFTSSGVGTVFASMGLNVPKGLAFGTNGNLYVVNVGDNTVAEFDPSGTEVAILTGGLNQPVDLAFDTIPEPSTLALLAAGSLMLSPVLKRKRT